MTRISLTAACVAFALTALGAGGARADCEADMLQLETAMKQPNLSPDAKAALTDAQAKSTSAMHKDDDDTCHSVIAAALPKAGLTLK